MSTRRAQRRRSRLLPNTAWPALLALILAGCDRSPEGTPAAPQAATDAESGGDRPLFADASAAAGLDFVHFNGMSGEYYFAEMTGGGAALLDYDRDGDLDVYLVQGQMLGPGRGVDQATFPPAESAPLSDRLYRNDLSHDADGHPAVRLVDVTAASSIRATGYAMGVAVGDIDNDGWPDIYLTNFGPNQLLRNRGDGTFEDVTAASGADDPRWSVSATFLDYDRDGRLDLFVGNYVEFTIATHKRCRAATGAADYCGPHSYAPVADRLLRNRGDGTFEDVTGRAGIERARGAALGVVAADFDLDGWPDIYVANDGMANQMWVARGDGTFEDRALLGGSAFNMVGDAEAGMGVDAGDFDNDGDEDLFLAHLTQETSTLYRNAGGGDFRDETVAAGLAAATWDATGFAAAWIDFDNDGWLDLMMLNGAVKVIESLRRAGDPYPLHQRNQLFRNLGGGRFEEVSARAGPAFELSEVSRGAAFGDVDNDGDTDVVVANNSGRARLLLNLTGQSSPWIGMRLISASTPRDMLGTWVRLDRSGAASLWRRAHSGGSYAAAGDARILFGLGTTAAAGEAQVTWPGGRQQRLRQLPVRAYTTVMERSLAAGP